MKANIYIRGGMRNEARIMAIKYGNKTKQVKTFIGARQCMSGTETQG